MKIIALVVLVAMLVPAVALAADPDFWGVDSRPVPIGPQDHWTDYGGGVSNGDQMFGDWYMQILWFFGGAIARRFA